MKILSTVGPIAHICHEASQMMHDKSLTTSGSPQRREHIYSEAVIKEKGIVSRM
jgi:hypothetical protein